MQIAAQRKIVASCMGSMFVLVSKYCQTNIQQVHKIICPLKDSNVCFCVISCLNYQMLFWTVLYCVIVLGFHLQRSKLASSNNEPEIRIELIFIITDKNGENVQCSL